MKQVSATIISNIPLIKYSVFGRPSFGPSSVTYHLVDVEAPAIASEAQPGQFITVSCGPDLILRRPLSIHRVDNSYQLSILFAVVGKGTKWLSQRQKNEKIDLLGPLGNRFHIEQASRDLLLLAGGIGIAPLVFLAQQAVKQGKSVKLLLGARTKDGLYPQERLPNGIKIAAITEDGSNGVTGMVSGILPDHIDKADQIYACGPLAMYKAIADQRQQWRRKKPIQVSLEVRLGCGLGACYSCSIKTKHGMKKVCRDGPVFNLDDFDESLWQEAKI